LEKTSSLLNEAEEAMSDIVWSVSPKHDTLISLSTRIRLAAIDLCRAHGIRCTFDGISSVDLPLADDIRRAFYLIFKEALNNVIKHAEAKNVFITIRFDGKILSVKIQDDGKGFEVGSNIESIGGNGMHNIRKRAEEICARTKITSVRQQGTTIYVYREMTQLGY
jgi:signal transduction histidine kinase